MTLLQRLIAVICLLTMLVPAMAQENTAPVPDVTGLTVPQAASTLNAAGFALGMENAIDLAIGGGQAAGTIFEQSVAGGTAAPIGSAVDVGVLRSDNVNLIYDDNDFTLVNTTNNIGNITGLRFVATEGSNPASFSATRWGSNVREQRCLQVWSVAVRDSKPISGCQDINWLSTNATGEHFWTQANGVQQFTVVEDGVTRAVCTGAPVGSQDSPTQCSFYMDGAGSADDLTSYLYITYTPNSVAIINQTQDRWMPTDRTTIFNFNPNLDNQGVSLIMGDAELFQNPQTVGDITQLAPGQCIVLTADNAAPELPTDCVIIAQRSLSSAVAFWLADFELESASTGSRHTCPAAVPDRPTICVVPQ